MNKVLRHSINISLHALSMMILLLPIVWFAGGLNWENSGHRSEQTHAFKTPGFVQVDRKLG